MNELLKQALLLKRELEQKEKDYEQMLKTLQEVAEKEGVKENDNFILEDDDARFCLSLTPRVNNDDAVSYCEANNLDNLIKIKKSVSINDLKKVMKIDQILEGKYATQSYTRTLTDKKEKALKAGKLNENK